MARFVFPLLLGIAGCAVLVSLGVWQLQRLAWKEAVLAEITARIAAAPVAVPDPADPQRDLYLPVTAAGRLTGEEALVLASRKGDGAGFRVIAVLETGAGRRLLLDRGFLPEAGRDTPRRSPGGAVTGNLHWPDEVDRFTPAPDAAAGLWFARDVPALAAALATEPVLIVARSDTGDGIAPMPVDASGIPNNHLGYAVQWFGLAAVWAGMTLLYLWRIRQRRA
jgi:surfeit locus 1 family protein